MSFMKIAPGTPMVRMLIGDGRKEGPWEDFISTEEMTFTQSTVFPSPQSIVRWPAWATDFALSGILAFRAEWKVNRHSVYYAIDVKDLSAKNLGTLYNSRNKVKDVVMAGSKLTKDEINQIYNALIKEAVASSDLQND